MGGQDDCDLIQCSPDNRAKCVDSKRLEACSAPHAPAGDGPRQMLQVHTDPTGRWAGPRDWPLTTMARRLRFMEWLADPSAEAGASQVQAGRGLVSSERPL